MWIFAILSTHIIWRVGVCARCVHLCSRRPSLIASSKALSGVLCGLRSLPFHSPSFCLSVSYLIDLAQKQSKDRYLRLRVKAYWCLGEVSPLSLSLCLHLSLPLLRSFQENLWAADQRDPQRCPPILQGRHSRWDFLPLYKHTNTHLPTFKQVSWLMMYIWSTKEIKNENLGALQNWVWILCFTFIFTFPHSTWHSVLVDFLSLSYLSYF